MARDNFRACMEEVFAHEGGLSLNPSDPGNWTGGKVGRGELRGTKYGIAAHANPDVDIRALTRDQAAAIYRRKYWKPAGGDDLPRGLDLVTFDPAVNSGVSRGVRWLQQGLGLKGPAVDGRMGPQTLSAAARADRPETVRRAVAARLGFLRGLRTWGTFGTGWSRRVARVEAVSLRMAAEGAGQPARPVLVETAAAARRSETRETAGAGASAAGGGGLTLADIPPWALWVALAVVALVVINQIGRRRHERARSEVMQQVAQEAQR